MSSPETTQMKQLAADALRVAFDACDQAGAVLKKHFGKLSSVDEKFQAGLVSVADRESEDTIKAILLDRFPQHQILGEETGFSGDTSEPAELRALWMIDPLDGTTNYVHRVPFFCISMGLQVGNDLLVGVVDAPLLGARYHAVAGQGAFLNGQSIRVSDRKTFREGLFATGFSNSDNTLDLQMELLTHVIRNARGIRRLGAAALDLCLVAEGVFDGFWEKNLQPWDTAAGTLIVREAGGRVTDFDGRDFQVAMNSILAGAPAQHQNVLELIQKIKREIVDE